MEIGKLAGLFLMLSFGSCTPAEPEPTDPAIPPVRLQLIHADLATADIVQRTCALYVAVRSHAWQEVVSFDQQQEGSMVRWNICGDKSMVACVKTPTADGDTIRTGIPWPYGAVGM